MSTKIILKKSSVVEAGVPKTPTIEDLEYGELALNYSAGVIFYKTSSNQIEQLVKPLTWENITGKPAVANAAPQWTINHTLVDGTRYLVNDIVYNGGYIFRAKFDNESIPTTSDLYWENLGPGSRINIDGRDIPNIQWSQIQNAPSIPTSLLSLGIQDGSNGDVLTTDGNGNFSFTTPSGGNDGNGGTGQILLNQNYRVDSGSVTIGNQQGIVDQFILATYRSAKYYIQVTTPYTYYVCDLIVLHDGVGTHILKTNEVYSPSIPGTFEISVINTEVFVKYTPSLGHTTNSIVFTRTLLANTGNALEFVSDLEAGTGTEDFATLPVINIDLNLPVPYISGDSMQINAEEDLEQGNDIIDLD